MGCLVNCFPEGEKSFQGGNKIDGGNKKALENNLGYYTN